MPNSIANITATIPIARRNSPITTTPRGKVGEVPSTPALRALVRPLLAFAASRVVFPRDYCEGEFRRYLVTKAPFSATLHASSSGVLKRTSEEVRRFLNLCLR